MREETSFIPKPMVEIGYRPILWHIMKIYSEHGFDDFVLALGYKGDVIRRYFVNYDILNTDVTVDLRSKELVRHDLTHDEATWTVTLAETGPSTMTGGRIKRAMKYIEGDTFLATYGDAVADVDVTALVDFHRRQGKLATVTAIHPPSRFGRLQLDAGGTMVEGFAEKPPGDEGWVSGGFFVFERGIQDYLDGDDCVLEREPLARLAAEGQLAAYRHDAYWQCLDTVRDAEMLREAWDGGRAPWAHWMGWR